MKAYQLQEIGKLNYIECNKPHMKDGWCIVKVKASGICSSDIPRIYTKGTYHFPTVPGHEFSGIVDEVSSKKYEKWLGKRVGVFPLIPCFECIQCKEHYYEMCTNYDYLGSRRDGGFAEYVTVPIWNLIELPSNVAFEVGAMLEPLAVAYHAIAKANVQKGDSVCVVGTGMIGFSIAQWAKLYEASIINVVGRSKEKQKIADMLEINYIAGFQKNKEKEYDVVVEAVGSKESISEAISITKPGGCLIMLGNPAGDICLEQDIYWRILRKQLVVKGTWNSSYEQVGDCDWTKVLEAIEQRKIRPDHLITHIYSQENLKEGLKMMHEHIESYCKVMTVWN